ncbi:MAG TPA: hypothetical protein O0X14_03420, partial [Methanocorpusculum sp.]|nr:hypothetical protein [Methanocorpusculum sp.]
FSGKELDDITGLYDHGARNRNPVSTLWYGIDPLFEKYPDFSPYNYCAGNPVKLVDLDGNRTFNVTNEDGSTETIEIPDGVDDNFDIQRSDFDLLQESFNNDNTENKDNYKGYFSQLGLGTVGYKLAVNVRSWKGRTEYAFAKAIGDFGEKTWKCNKFVYDRLRKFGLIGKYKDGCPPTASTYADPDIDIKAGNNGQMKVVNDGSIKLGDIVAGKYPYSDATGHVEIVTKINPDGTFLTTAAHRDDVFESYKGYLMYKHMSNNNFNPVTIRRAQ